MAARNPNPALITDAIWSVWVGFDAHEPTALLGGIYADKPGYHNHRARLRQRWPSDYSIRLAADLRGPDNKAAALDLTMSTAAMIRTTKRLDVAARAKDPRLYRNEQPVLREIIGTLDGIRVYCYDLVERRVYWNRGLTHLWHLHGSWIRQFVADMLAAAGILSILVGESLAAWTARTSPTVTPSPARRPPMIRIKAKDAPTRYLSNGARIPNMDTDRALEAAGIPLVEVTTTTEALELLAGGAVGMDYGLLATEIVARLPPTNPAGLTGADVETAVARVLWQGISATGQQG